MPPECLGSPATSEVLSLLTSLVSSQLMAAHSRRPPPPKKSGCRIGHAERHGVLFWKPRSKICCTGHHAPTSFLACPKQFTKNGPCVARACPCSQAAAVVSVSEFGGWSGCAIRTPQITDHRSQITNRRFAHLRSHECALRGPWASPLHL